MNGRITVGMPWSLVGSVFPNRLSDASSYSKTYKVVNNTPYVNINSKKIDKREHGWGVLVYVTVRNGKVSMLDILITDNLIITNFDKTKQT